jgi:hypothetical protein
MNSSKIKCILAALIFLVASTFTSSASATLIGNTISLTGLDSYPSNAIIGSGIEFWGLPGGQASVLNFDFGANTLTISSNLPFNSFWSGYGTYVFSGFTDTITSFDLVSNTGFFGDITSNLSFTNNSISLGIDGGASLGAVAVYDIGTTVSPVPEPDTYAMLLAGLGLLGFTTLRRKQNFTV